MDEFGQKVDEDLAQHDRFDELSTPQPPATPNPPGAALTRSRSRASPPPSPPPFAHYTNAQPSPLPTPSPVPLQFAPHAVEVREEKPGGRDDGDAEAGCCKCVIM